MYYGEASITQDEMKQFFETAHILQIKGLQGDILGIGQNIQEELEHEYKETNGKDEEGYYGTEDSFEYQETIVESFNSLHDSVNDTFEGKKLSIKANKELDHQLTEMIEKTDDGKWKCKVCGKTATMKQHSVSHAETHIEGLSFTCNVCSKTCSTRQYLRQHVSNNHSGDVFSCNLCDKTGMNRKAYYNHNKNHKK